MKPAFDNHPLSIEFGHKILDIANILVDRLTALHFWDKEFPIAQKQNIELNEVNNSTINTATPSAILNNKNTYNKEIDEGYLDLILTANESLKQVNSTSKILIEIQKSINYLMQSGTQSLNIILESSADNKSLLFREKLNELAGNFDIKFRTMSENVSYFEIELDKTVEYYRKGYELYFQFYDAMPDKQSFNKSNLLSELVSFKDSFTNLMIGLELVKVNYITFRDSFDVTIQVTKEFTQVQKFGVSVIEQLIEVATKSINKFSSFISYLDIKIKNLTIE